MSFDIFLQAFRDGDAADGDASAVLRILSPHFESAPVDRFVRLVTPDGAADVYGIGDSSAALMFNHAGGEGVFQLMYEVARDAGLVIRPVGCPTLVCSAEQTNHLPSALRERVRVIRTGADIIRAIEEA